MAIKSQRDAIRAHLIEHGSITSMEAFTLYGATRLSSIIYDLRKHYNIDSVNMESVNRFGRKVIFSKYILKEDIK